MIDESLYLKYNFESKVSLKGIYDGIHYYFEY